VADVSIEFLGVVIVALSSIFTNVLAWYLNYRSNRIKFETESRAGYVQEVLRDHYKLHNFLRQLEATPIKDEAIRVSEQIQKIVDERPYNFRSEVVDDWIGLNQRIILLDEYPREEIKKLSKEVWETICYFQGEYEKLLGIKRNLTHTTQLGKLLRKRALSAVRIV
jgi:hypothetical protein